MAKSKAKAVETYDNGIAITKALMTNVQDWTSCQGAASKATESLVTFNIKFGKAIDKDMAWFPLITAKETTTEEAETTTFDTFWKKYGKQLSARGRLVSEKQARKQFDGCRALYRELRDQHKARGLSSNLSQELQAVKRNCKNWCGTKGNDDAITRRKADPVSKSLWKAHGPKPTNGDKEKSVKVTRVNKGNLNKTHQNAIDNLNRVHGQLSGLHAFCLEDSQPDNAGTYQTRMANITDVLKALEAVSFT
tara:strand:- start:387 stop:1136 length:750 start_codon:yes stop_codon:yes gene_type:complete